MSLFQTSHKELVSTRSKPHVVLHLLTLVTLVALISNTYSSNLLILLKVETVQLKDKVKEINLNNHPREINLNNHPKETSQVKATKLKATKVDKVWVLQKTTMETESLLQILPVKSLTDLHKVLAL